MLCRDACGKPSCHCQDNYERKALDIRCSKNHFANQLQARRRGELTLNRYFEQFRQYNIFTIQRQDMF